MSENLSKTQKKGEAHKPEALWLEKGDMYLLHWAYDYLSRSYDFGDKPYSQLVELSLDLLSEVWSNSEYRVFRFSCDEFSPKYYDEEKSFEFSSINITEKSSLMLNRLCAFFRKTGRFYSRRTVCIMAMNFLRFMFTHGYQAFSYGYSFDMGSNYDRDSKFSALSSILADKECALFPLKSVSFAVNDGEE